MDRTKRNAGLNMKKNTINANIYSIDNEGDIETLIRTDLTSVKMMKYSMTSHDMI